MQDLDLLIQAAVRALVPLGRLLDVPGHASGQPAELLCHRLSKQLAEATPGARVVSGWALESVRSKETNDSEWRVVFDHRSLVRLPGGQLVCPITKSGEKIRFVEDRARPYDFADLVGYNQAAFANYRLVGAMGPAIPAFSIAWMAPFCGDHLYSADRRRARRVSFASADPFAFAAGQGLDRTSVLDMAFASDLDTVMNSVPSLGSARDGGELLAKLREIQPKLRPPREV